MHPLLAKASVWSHPHYALTWRAWCGLAVIGAVLVLIVLARWRQRRLYRGLLLFGPLATVLTDGYLLPREDAEQGVGFEALGEGESLCAAGGGVDGPGYLVGEVALARPVFGQGLP